MPLRPKQQRFIVEYLKDMNATQAAKRAGYSQKTAHTIGHENLTKPEIQEALAREQAKLAQNHGVTIDRIVKEYARIAFSDARKMFDAEGNLKRIHELDDDTAAAVASFEEESRTVGNDILMEIRTKKAKLWDKTKGLEMLGKHLGMFKEHVEVSGRVFFVDESVQKIQTNSEKLQAGQQTFKDEE